MQINVNGQMHDVVATLDTPLLYVLRNDLGLNATRYGCGLGRCGVCTIHLDGQPVFSCEVPLSDLAGREITTLEGLGTADALHPLQQAFLDEQAAQCGYCIPGIIMTTGALLNDTPDPADEQIREALRGTLCRCGSHARILRAIQKVIAGREAPDVPAS